WTRTPAVISSVHELGEAIENNVLFEILVRVEPPDAESYETTLARRMSIVEAAHNYRPGTRVTVRVCPYAPQIVEDLKLDLYPQPQPSS
ncbi:MAG: hypothetical protein KC457_25415, partial [Myxococcales bacterium]|nr:hypothetical protein [Myxococcales bacterium]